MPPRGHGGGRGHHHTPGGGPRGVRGGFGGGGGWGWGGGPCSPGERFCCGSLGALFWCCLTPPPPPPPTVTVVHEHSYSPVSTDPPAAAPAGAVPVAVKTGLRELYANEYREGDTAVRYHLRIPADCVPGAQTLKVELGGRQFSLDIPDYCKREETVVVIAPAIVNYGDA